MVQHDNDAQGVLDAVKEAIPTLRHNGAQTEKQRWLVEENINLLEKAGVFRMAVPERFGGLDLPAEQQAVILAEIARGCGSTGWVSMVWVSTAWIASLYPDKAQEEVFADGSVRISGGFTPSGTLVPTEGGYRLSGSWRFNTGVPGARWNVHAAMVEHPDGRHEELFALVPTEDITVADDWDVFGAAGTGSATSTADDVFVPAHRVVGVEVYDASTGNRWNADVKGRNYNLTSYILATCAPVYLGIAKAALELFIERLPGKGITYTSWTEQKEHPYTQIQLAHAANKIAACEALSGDWLRVMQGRAGLGEKMTVEEKAAVRGQVGYVVQATKEAVETLYNISSASTIVRSNHFQRAFRDIEALSLHGLLTPVSSLEAHGRVLLGLEPGTDYI
ncbi:acyl-CoA dehydrogenase family protein [Streptomyces sp. NBC_00083]|uniref:acyl-CoA dehydrogenase family protein n=1 Tax=Streptomyces sp. NBC_00083 TaxID=2975647 RepID=UPI0022539C63|nr:acyl-CoA dehydrogenase family protein [Streptomyces sp. NBC_00083]MCX5387483.1 acyl-CoA dehydrogenase family protein [Streptomyces sp. NBC_00083]